jgi:hypothetical protein
MTYLPNYDSTNINIILVGTDFAALLSLNGLFGLEVVR